MTVAKANGVSSVAAVTAAGRPVQRLNATAGLVCVETAVGAARRGRGSGGGDGNGSSPGSRWSWGTRKWGWAERSL